MQEDLGHAERIGHQAGVLAAGAAEAVERVLGDIVAALHGDLLDGVGHVLHGDAQEALGDLLRALQRSEEHTSELQSLMRISYAVFCLKKKKKTPRPHTSS